jgi:NTE family protein
MVDGGVRNVSPLGDVLDADPAEVVIINCDPRRPPVAHQSFRHALDIGRAALGIAINEIFANDLREFIRINRNVREAAAHGVTLHNEHGKPYKYYDYKLIEPNETLGDSLDFSRESLDRYMELGWARAREVLG